MAFPPDEVETMSARIPSSKTTEEGESNPYPLTSRI